VREQVELTPGCCGEPGAEQRWCGDVGLWAEGGAWCPLDKWCLATRLSCSRFHFFPLAFAFPLRPCFSV
jgi:hypothetical protein